MSRYLMPDVVVCIPGITGSVLRKGNKDIWNISGSALFNALGTLGNSLQDLKLEEDPVDVDDVDGIYAPSVIRDVHFIPGIWKIDGYTKMVKHLEDQFEVTHGENLFEFPYDWRRDNRVSSRQLATKARKWLADWRQKSGNQKAKLIIIGHSMGGLIARHFIECREGWRDTRMLVTLATPYRGSLYSLGTLVNGKKIKFFDLTDVSRSMTALYQLMPIYACYDGGDGKLVRVTEAQIPHLDAAKAKAALAFHQEISDAVEDNKKIPEYSPRYDIRPIVGIEQPTAQSAKRDGDKVVLIRRHGKEDLGGDGTVPRPSAEPPEFERHENVIYAFEKHGSLQNDDDVLHQLHGVLTQPSFDPGKYRDAAGKIGQGLDMDDWVEPQKPFPVAAKPQQDPGGLLLVEVQNVETGEVVQRQRLTRGDDEWHRAELTLPEGVYRITSKGANVEPVTDLVTVIAAE